VVRRPPRVRPDPAGAALGRLTRDGSLSFRDAFRLLLKRGAIIHLDPADDVEPGTSPEDADAQGGGTGS
jgi:hypothetical protein